MRGKVSLILVVWLLKMCHESGLQIGWISAVLISHSEQEIEVYHLSQYKLSRMKQKINEKKKCVPICCWRNCMEEKEEVLLTLYNIDKELSASSLVSCSVEFGCLFFQCIYSASAYILVADCLILLVYYEE